MEIIVDLSKKTFSSNRLKSEIKKKKRPTKPNVPSFKKTNKIYKPLAVLIKKKGK